MPADYNAETICRALGLAGFADVPAPADTLRVVLRPSFHPEVFLALTPAGDRVDVEVVAGQWMYRQVFDAPIGRLWCFPPRCADGRPVPRHRIRTTHVDTFRTAATLPADVFRELRAALRAGMSQPARPVVQIDGVSFDVFDVEAGERRLHEATPGRPPAAEGAVSRLVERIWHAVDDPDCRNALADVAGYFSVRLERTVPPAVAPRMPILVLGDEAERTELARALTAASGGKFD
ncbi:hypothetical protein [Tahibacter soli]|uniref:Uncharacterized protein n=1 Tax=Tahibacter soli TaxID=2983605 RepID=A0A9X3YQ87_9GAMM|nr:hypothetical protein [Tahibacter soli]MDC8015455.1 hypothetical protein [Tahibacter soli]